MLAGRRKDAENKMSLAKLQSQLDDMTREKNRAIQREKETSRILRDLQMNLRTSTLNVSTNASKQDKSGTPPLPSVM